jgi:4-amino-4-deoxy-L-arabinose transferase-like glycosyltransferase
MTTAPGQAATAPEQSTTLPSPRRATAELRERLAPHHLVLAGVLALSAVLNLNRLSQNGYGNIFYSAGVKSMLRSFHNFFFVSFDPGGLIMVDKPPLGLWPQAASAKIFGFTPLSLLLPEAIAGILSVALLYHLLARRIGAWPAIAGALTLAVFPSFVAISRTNNVDALLILLMLLACGAALKAIETGRWRTMIWCGVLVGLAFNTKTLAAYLIVPGIALGYLIGAPGSLGRRLGALLVAGLVMLVVSFSWMAVVELTPASQRPFVGSSTNNTELGLTFSYNGFGRVEGQAGGPGQIPAGTGGLGRAVGPAPARPGAGAKPPKPLVAAPPLSATLPNGRARNPTAFGGPTSPLRLFGKGLGDQGAWMLPLAVAGLIAFTLLLGSDQLSGDSSEVPSVTRSQDSSDGRARGGRDRHDRRLAVLFVLGGWFVVEAAVLSLSKGIIHPYYVSALGPGVAAMVGAGIYAFAELAGRRNWLLLLLAGGVAATVPVQISLLHKEHYMSWFTTPLIAMAIVGVCAILVLCLLARRRAALVAIALTLLALVIAPAVYSSTNWLAPVQSTFPAAGPRQAAGPANGFGVNDEHLSVDRSLLRYVESHHPGKRWVILFDASNTGAPMILLGAYAGSLGGFSGVDPALNGPGLARLVAHAEARYVLLGGEFSQRGGTAATAAVQRACRELPLKDWLSDGLSPNSVALFDCAGRERELAAS